MSRLASTQLSRRTLLAGTAAAWGMPGWVRAASVPSTLRAEPGMIQLAPEGYGQTAIWGYQGTVPGPLLRLAQGEKLSVAFENGLPQPSSVHWHGIRIDNRMDGVTGLTQDAVAPGSSFDYDFGVPDAGTYWYHPHNRTWEQMARGLYGALIVEEAEAPVLSR